MKGSMEQPQYPHRACTARAPRLILPHGAAGMNGGSPTKERGAEKLEPDGTARAAKGIRQWGGLCVIWTHSPALRPIEERRNVNFREHSPQKSLSTGSKRILTDGAGHVGGDKPH